MKKQFKKGIDWKLSKDFNVQDFDCKCSYPECQWTLVETDHITHLQEKRNAWGKPIHVLEGYRCERRNRDMAGESGSKHLQGEASIISVEGMSPNEVADACTDFNGCGRYNDYTYVDSRSLPPGRGPSRWDFRRRYA